MITDIRLQNFRSYRDESFEFSPGVNIIVGPNASGKTNLLEAVLVMARGNSYRAKDNELIRFNKPWARLESHVLDSPRIVKIVASPLEKNFEITGKTYRRLPGAQTLPVVLFEPNHLAILTGVPELRRAYLDDLLEQTVAGYKDIRRRYLRALSQRNRLLKLGEAAARQQAFAWNLRLSQLGGRIASERRLLSDQINQSLPGIYQNLSGAKIKVNFVYQTSLPTDTYETALLKKLETTLERDCMLGFTTSGPHRDNLQVFLDDKPLNELASRGEVRTTILALKAVELKVVEEALGQPPMLLLDDVFSELDGRRRHTLTDFIKPYQTFITTTDADTVITRLAINSVIPLTNQH